MENRRFDDLTRSVANGASRRQALKVLLAGIAAGVLPGLARRPAAADEDKDGEQKCRDLPDTMNTVGMTCGKGGNCCFGKCVKPCSDGIVNKDCHCFGYCCPEGQICSFDDGTCYCADQFGVSPCGPRRCDPDVAGTQCFIEQLPDGSERLECRPCLMSGPRPPGTPCCRGGYGSGGVDVCYDERVEEVPG